MRAQVKKAIAGDSQAARFVQENAWSEDTPAEIIVLRTDIEVSYADRPEPVKKRDSTPGEGGFSPDPAPR